MALRNRIISLDYSIKSPADTFTTRVENGTSHYRITNVSPIYSLMISSSLTSQTKQNFQLSLLRFFIESRPVCQNSPAGFHEVHKQCTAFPLHNIVYFSRNWKLINTSKHEDLHSSFSIMLRDLFFLTPATLRHKN